MSVGGRGDCYLTIAKNKSIRGKIENELFAWNFSLSLVREKVSIMPKFCQPLSVCIVHCHLISFLLCVLTRYQKFFHQVHPLIETGLPCNVLVPTTYITDCYVKNCWDTFYNCSYPANKPLFL